jgi:hypothetical protein
MSRQNAIEEGMVTYSIISVTFFFRFFWNSRANKEFSKPLFAANGAEYILTFLYLKKRQLSD